MRLPCTWMSQVDSLLLESLASHTSIHMLNSATAITSAQQYARAGKHAEAEKIYRDLLRHHPGNAVAWHNLGMACWIQGRLNEALPAIQKAIELRPDYVEALNNYGAILAADKRPDEAVAALRAAAGHRRGWAEPFINIGNIFRNLHRYDEAINAYQEATLAEPKNAEAQHFLASTLGRQGLRERAKAHFIEALRLTPKDAVVHSSLCFLTQYDPHIHPAVLLSEHEWWDRLHGQGLTPVAPYTNSRDPNRKLRVGYVSPDFRAHPVARYMLPIYESNDPNNIEIFSYAQMYKFDGITDRFKAHSTWRSTYGLSDLKIAEMIRADQIDILIDLAGHTGGNRISIFTHRAGPVQVSYVGYSGTTGLKSIQYRLTDRITDPPDEPSYYSEELIYLPDCWCAYTPHENAPVVNDPPLLKSGFITFGSLQNLLKINDGVIDLWMRVFNALPTSRLRIYRDTLDEMARNILRSKFVARGLSPERLELLNTADDGSGHLAEYGKIDLCIDTLPWSGHATTCESLWMGVPMVTLRGTRHAGRMCSSILTAVGLQELIAETPQQFIQIAVDLASDPARLTKLRRSLREQMRLSPLCDAPRFAHQFEATLRELWNRWCTSTEPQK